MGCDPSPFFCAEKVAVDQRTHGVIQQCRQSRRTEIVDRSAVIFRSGDQGAVCFSLGAASSAWITFSNASCGRLPLSRFPLTKNPGVPATPALSPNCRSCSICAVYLPLDRQEPNCFSSSLRP